LKGKGKKKRYADEFWGGNKRKKKWIPSKRRRNRPFLKGEAEQKVYLRGKKGFRAGHIDIQTRREQPPNQPSTCERKGVHLEEFTKRG